MEKAVQIWVRRRKTSKSVPKRERERRHNRKGVVLKEKAQLLLSLFPSLESVAKLLQQTLIKQTYAHVVVNCGILRHVRLNVDT